MLDHFNFGAPKAKIRPPRHVDAVGDNCRHPRSRSEIASHEANPRSCGSGAKLEPHVLAAPIAKPLDDGAAGNRLLNPRGNHAARPYRTYGASRRTRRRRGDGSPRRTRPSITA